MVSDTANRLQTAEDGVAAADNADDDTQNCNSLELADAEDTGNIEDILKYNCAGVKDDRQIEDGVHHNDDEREHQLGAAAKRASISCGWWSCPF